MLILIFVCACVFCVCLFVRAYVCICVHLFFIYIKFFFFFFFFFCSSPSPSPFSSSPLPIFQHPDGDSQRLTAAQRYGVEILHEEGHDAQSIADAVGVARSTVYRRIAQYESTHNINDEQREGRPKKISFEVADAIIAEAIAHPKQSTPKRLKRKLTTIMDTINADDDEGEPGMCSKNLKHTTSYCSTLKRKHIIHAQRKVM